MFSEDFFFFSPFFASIVINPFGMQHCVFGKVVEGMDVVKAVEGVGSQSGATRSKVMIATCGQL